MLAIKTMDSIVLDTTYNIRVDRAWPYEEVVTRFDIAQIPSPEVSNIRFQPMDDLLIQNSVYISTSLLHITADAPGKH